MPTSRSSRCSTRPDQAHLGSDQAHLLHPPSRCPPSLDHRGTLAAFVACITGVDGWSGLRRYASMVAEEFRHPHATWVFPSDASCGGGGRGCARGEGKGAPVLGTPVGLWCPRLAYTRNKGNPAHLYVARHSSGNLHISNACINFVDIHATLAVNHMLHTPCALVLVDFKNMI
jgi:hypothetical protein